ncbi:hypothetical protein RAB80_015694 [Fusarium oxysporum f. sp. vasinfectum]|nr:hypothetical protein RAB80_015694 [Fusarium oxysporum f. sp. vasinfectum]KAK2926031.1 hypothetical protein FoTM2_014400 [Fusarium oxysporum f. sp. vasinfectum]
MHRASYYEGIVQKKKATPETPGAYERPPLEANIMIEEGNGIANVTRSIKELYVRPAAPHNLGSLNDYILSIEERSCFKANIESHAVKASLYQNVKGCDFEDPYLKDFEFSSPIAGVARLAPHAIDTEDEVYHHSDRQGLAKRKLQQNPMHTLVRSGSPRNWAW